MKRMLINAQSEELRVAIINDGLLVDLDIERPDIEQKKSNIYKGKISSIEPSLNAVFVDYGSERHGFLPLKEISREYFQSQADEHVRGGDIQKLLKLGQEVVIQVDKDERGTKGAALTTFITLAGSYLVLMPNNPRAGGISRRIEGDERDHLRNLLSSLTIPEGMGVIIRTAGVNRSVEELQWDLDFLLRYWDAIQQATHIKKAPYLIHQESDVIIRGIRDNLRHDISEIIIDEPKAFDRAKNYLQQIRPDFADNIKLYTDTLPLFSRFQVERQIELAYQREVQLPSGGSIVIDHTEALVSIDINSARATKGGNIEETACHTNLEAAEEIARQLRIRDIGGLVVIDFIDMMQNKNQREVENRLRESLQMDRARIQIGRISRFGLLEMSRQRLRSSLTRSIHVTCPRCDGQGSIRGVESLAHSIVHLVQEQAVKTQNIQIQVQAPIDVATYILNERRDVIENIHKETGVDILIIPNQYLQSPQYSIKHVKADIAHRSSSSYKLVKFPKVDGTTTQKGKPATSQAAEPAINKFLADSSAPAPTAAKATSPGMIKRIWDAMFGNSDDMRNPSTARKARTTTPANKTTSSTQRRKPAQGGQRRDNRNRNENRDTRSRDGNRNTNRDDNRGNRKRDDNRNNRNRDDNRGNRRQAESRDDNRGNRMDTRDDNRGNRVEEDVRDDNRGNRRDDNRGNQEARGNNRQRNNRNRNRSSQRRDENKPQSQPQQPAPAATQPVAQPTPSEAPKAAAPVAKPAPAPKPQNLVTTPSPLETQSSELKQVRSAGGHSQQSIQEKAKELNQERRSETKAAPTYTGLGSADGDLKQVRTTKED